MKIRPFDAFLVSAALTLAALFSTAVSAQAPAAGDASPAAPAPGAPAGQAAAPDALVKSVSDDVLEIVRSDKDIQAGNSDKVMKLVEEKILPHFDFERMTALAVGTGWRQATPEQRNELINEFKTLLVRTYSSGLAAYRNQTIDYRPLRMKPTDTDAIVRSEVKQSGAQPVTIDYRMEKSGADWKVYDVSIGGVSLVTTYRDSFGQEVRQGGVDGLIKQLVAKNKQLAEGRGARPQK